jgi:hypothetical protein
MGLWRDRAARAPPFVAVAQRACAGLKGVRTKFGRADAPHGGGGALVGACALRHAAASAARHACLQLYNHPPLPPLPERDCVASRVV